MNGPGAELRAEGKTDATKADGLQAVFDSIAKVDGKIIFRFKNAGKFTTRYSILDVQDAAPH